MASVKSISAAKEKLMQALADMSSFGKMTFDVKAVAAQSGYSCITGKAVREALKDLKNEKVFERTKNGLTLTEEGIKLLPKADESNLPTDEGAQEKMLEQISKSGKSKCGAFTNEEKTKAVFEVLLDGKAHSREELAEAAGYKRIDIKAFRNLINQMTDLGCLEKNEEKQLQLTDSAWPVGGRPSIFSFSDDQSSRKRKAPN